MQFEIQASEIDTSKISELFNTKYQFAGKAYFSADMTLDISDPKVMEMSLQRGVVRVQDGLLQAQQFSELSGKIAAISG